MTSIRRPPTSGEQGKTVTHSIVDLTQRECPYQPSSHFDEQRNTVEPSAYRGHGLGVLFGELEVCYDRPRPVDEQANGIRPQMIDEQEPSVRIGLGQSGDRVHRLSG